MRPRQTATSLVGVLMLIGLGFVGTCEGAVVAEGAASVVGGVRTPTVLTEIAQVRRLKPSEAERRLTRAFSTWVDYNVLPAFARQKKVYYLLDDYRTYNRNWQAEEEALLKSCDHVVAVSPALAELLETRVQGVASRLTVSPNAVPASWIPSSCPSGPAAIPGFQKGAPLIGVIGSISSRLRLGWLCEAVDRTPSFNWLFVGGVEKGELLDEDKPFLEKLERHSRCYFMGELRYEALLPYARGLDVALMPYSERSTNPFGSAMRLFFHLPFGQPIIATKGCKMVEGFIPLVAMAGSPDELVARLNASTLEDGLREARWRESFRHTWTARADALRPILIA